MSGFLSWVHPACVLHPLMVNFWRVSHSVASAFSPAGPNLLRHTFPLGFGLVLDLVFVLLSFPSLWILFFSSVEAAFCLVYIWRLLLRLGECLDVARFLCSLLLDVILLADPWGACGAVRLSLFSLIVFWLLSGVLFSVCLCLRRLMSIVRRSALLLAFQVWAAWPTNTLSLLSYISWF